VRDVLQVVPSAFAVSSILSKARWRIFTRDGNATSDLYGRNEYVMGVIYKTSCLRRSLLSAVVTLSVVYGFQQLADALTQSGSLDDLKFSVYAPDWTWQKRDINILVTFRNTGERAGKVTVSLVFPPGKEHHFRYDGARIINLTVPAGKTVRHAFTNIVALDGVPRQVYDFELVVYYQGQEARVRYPVRTIRGAVVSPGKWALFLPGGVALAWCVVFVAVIRRFAEPGAWRIPAEPVRERDMLQPWIRAGQK